MSNESPTDRAIKKSAENEPEYVAKPSAPRLEGQDKATVVAEVIRTMGVAENFSHVHVIDYPSFNGIWDHMLVNFYYDNDEDPTTTIASFRYYLDGNVESC